MVISFPSLQTSFRRPLVSLSYLQLDPTTDTNLLILWYVVGNITLNSSSPFDAPLINPNLLASRFDILTMVSAIKSARRFMSAPSWNGWIVEEYGEFAEAMSDAEIEEYARNNSATVFHPCCTAAMGPGAPGGDRTNGTETERRSERGGGVLKSDLTVKGTVGLRVVDASAFVSSLLWHKFITVLLFCLWPVRLAAVHSVCPHTRADVHSRRACCGPDQGHNEEWHNLIVSVARPIGAR